MPCPLLVTPLHTQTTGNWARDSTAAGLLLDKTSTAGCRSGRLQPEFHIIQQETEFVARTAELQLLEALLHEGVPERLRGGDPLARVHHESTLQQLAQLVDLLEVVGREVLNPDQLLQQVSGWRN